jgi:hypothetical protein
MRIIQSTKILFLIGVYTCILSIDSYAQNVIVEQDSIEIEFVKNEKLKNKHPQTYISKKLHKGFRITLLEIDIKTLDINEKEFDPNKFYLVSEKPKFRYRPLDIFTVESKTKWTRFELVTKKKPKATSNMQETYDPDIKDSYLDYKIDGVSDIRIPINLGSVEFPDKHIFHFKPQILNSTKIVLYFYISSDFIKRGTLYYGNEEIAETDLK